ncbi:hypothetical protein TWF694_011341 [Orbilia ellipsospora]|uniref:Extracellular membrane protein CFEM domain-containing protein n=1 Tax=Orbilia ellipsospora TaxID=2528407 RepID=A0AAV9X4Z2_9PEZI
MSRLTRAPTTIPDPTDCVPICADIISCGETYGGCVTSCAGVPFPTFTVPDYVVEACLTFTEGTISEPEPTMSSSSTESVTPIGTGTANTRPTTVSTEAESQTIHTIGTETGVFTILTDTNLGTSTPTGSPQTNTGTPTTSLAPSTETKPSSAELGKGNVKLSVIFGAIFAVAVFCDVVF